MLVAAEIGFGDSIMKRFAIIKVIKMLAEMELNSAVGRQIYKHRRFGYLWFTVED